MKLQFWYLLIEGLNLVRCEYNIIDISVFLLRSSTVGSLFGYKEKESVEKGKLFSDLR